MAGVRRHEVVIVGGGSARRVAGLEQSLGQAGVSSNYA
jgi:hypothetical protein